MRKAKHLHLSIAFCAFISYFFFMDFHELEAFLILADTLHFAKASTLVHLSPSALSRLLGRLEEDLGVCLFERDTRRVVLTEEGEAFREFARETIHRRDDLKLQIGNHDDKLRGILRVYASVTACYSILPPFVETLKNEHPELRLSVETGDPADAAEAVREGTVELALGALPPNGFKDLDCYSVRKTPLVFASSLSGPYGKLNVPSDGIVSEAILSTIPLILPKSGLGRERFDKWARLQGVKPDIAAETAGNEAILALARLGVGLGLVPKLVLENGPFAEGLAVYHAGAEFGDYDIGFIQRKNSNGSDTVRIRRTVITDVIHRTYQL